MPRSSSATSIRIISPAARSSSRPELARRTIEATIARPLGLTRRAGGARHPSRPQRPDGGRHPPRVDRPRHRPAPLHAAAAGRRRRRCMRLRAGARTGHPAHRSCRRIPACCRRPACWPRPIEHESSVAFPRLLEGLDWPEVRTGARRAATRHAPALMRERRRARRADADRLLRRCLLRRAGLSSRGSASRPTPPTRSRRSTATSYAAHDRIYGHAPKAPARHRQSAQHPPQHRRPAGDGGRLRARTRDSALDGAHARILLPPKAAGSVEADGLRPRRAEGDGDTHSRSGHRRAGRHDDADRARLARDGRSPHGNLIIDDAN